jgi:uncharacterized membrane protein AbrB (regulator of aidB expression)
MNTSLLVALAAILIGTRLPSYFRRQQMPKKERILLVVIVFSLLGLALLAGGGFSFLLSLFRQ